MMLQPFRFSRLGGALAPLAIATLCATSCALWVPNQGDPLKDIQQLSHSKAVSVGEGPHGIALAGGVIVNSNPKSGDISLLDPEAESELTRLDFPGGKEANSPTQSQATLDGAYAVTMDSKAFLLRVIKGETRSHVGTVALGKKPGSKLVWADAETAYLAVGESPDANVLKVSWPNGFEAEATTASLTLSRPGAEAFVPGFLAVGGGFLAVPNGPDNAVTIVDLNAPEAVMTLQEGNNPGPIAISTVNDGAILIFGNKSSSTVVLYDLKAKKKLAGLNVGSTPTDMVLRADGRYAYVTCSGAGEVAVIDVAGRKLHGKVKVGRGAAPSKPVHLYAVAKPEGAGAGEQIWVGGDGDASVTVLDAETQKAIAVVAVGEGHHKMAFTATKAFVSNLVDNTVSVIDRRAIR